MTAVPAPSPAEFMATIPRSPESNTAWGASYARELRGVLTRQAGFAPRSLQLHLGPSEIGVPCDRQVVGKMAGITATNHVADPWPSVVGTAVHAWLAEAFRADNDRERLLRWVTEVRVVPHPDYPGHSDLYDALEYAVVDHKILGPTTLAKVRSAGGPPVAYKVQLLLYAAGFRNAGLPVRRVVLAAWPRTSSTLDGMYVWDHPCTAADEGVVAQVLAAMEARKAAAIEVLRGRLDLMAVRATPDSDTCYFCLAGDTEVVTRGGVRPIRELAGTTPELLIPRTGKNPGLQAKGDFTPVPVRPFGEQQLQKITLTSHRAEKIVYATAEHRWLLIPRASRAQDPSNPLRPLTDRWPEKTTTQLEPGDRLRSLRAAVPARAQLMPPAIAQGFVFGDGTRGQGDRPATLSLYDNGKDEALLPFFPLYEPKDYGSVKHIYGLPRFWKDLPPIRESRTFLLSWLAGYFAADGTVSKDGQVNLDSADERNIRFARDVAAICGIGYSPVRSKWRAGTGTELTQLWTIGLRRRDLPGWFFIIKEHATRAAAANQDEARGTYWTVKSVERTDRIEEVFCATVPGAGMFGLADDLLTGNCPFYRPQSAYDGGRGCPGDIMPRYAR